MIDVRSDSGTGMRAAMIALVLVLPLGLAAQPVPPAKGEIKLDPARIPAVTAPMPVLALKYQAPPTDFVKGLLKTVAPNTQDLVPLGRAPYLPKTARDQTAHILAAFDKDGLVSYVDTKTGDAELFPSLAELKLPATALDPKRATAVAQELFGRQELIGRDDTRFTIGEPLALYGAQGTQGQTADASDRALLFYVPVLRFVDTYPVHGPGSRGLAIVGADDKLKGFLRRWKTATSVGTVKETRTREQVARAIRAQLAPMASRADIEVDSIELAYYDGNASFLQPVYRFTAIERILSSKYEKARPDENFLIGFVPIGAVREPIPSLAAPQGVPPVEPKKLAAGAAAATAPVAPGDPLVGRYVVRNDDSNWVGSANGFWNNLTAFGGGASFTNSQYYWAHPFEFTSNASSYVNSVHVALTEVHGDWWLFSTLRNCCDLVDVNTDINNPGYGAAAGGRLAYWIIHSCEVVPSPIDNGSHWPDAWWDVFGGLHSVLGYRTIMYIADGTTPPFGLSIRFGAPVVSAWLNAVSSASAYSGHPTMTMHGQVKPLGRASTISMCGRENDSVYNVSAQPRANCLRTFWFGN
jgi:Family of unknown function (DUF6345)